MSDRVTITILVDNHAKSGLVAEHGLSFWIEADGKKIIFDTGGSPAWHHNAKTLGIDGDAADILVLSHGHCDHTGGIPAILRNGHTPHVFAHPGVVVPRYSLRDATANAIHMPRESMRALDKVEPEQMHWVYGPVPLTEKIRLTGPVPRKTDFEDTGGPFYLDPHGKRPDFIEDDLSLWVETDRGLILCTGCCHAGLVNTIHAVQRLNPGVPILAVIGGLHLVTAGINRLNQTVDALRKSHVQRLIPLHCTGDMAIDFLIDRLGNKITPGMAGQTYGF